ncbi:hypothetical protein ASC87_00715 [Rhizobacter sp. Root1221]|nr:hypothetical protein ASC87_00715 [Rhizobacter sp. Root1221]
MTRSGSASSGGIAAQDGVARDLVGIEQRGLSDVGLEVLSTQLCLQLTDPGGGLVYRTRRGRPLRKQAVELALCVQQGCTQPCCLALVLVHQGTGGVRLGIAEVEILCQFKHMRRAGIAVQFGGLGEAGAAPCEQAGDISVREGFDRALMLAGIAGGGGIGLGTHG